MSKAETRVRRNSTKKEREAEPFRHNISTENYNGGERRPSRKKFSWVRRLMQGQTRNQNEEGINDDQEHMTEKKNGVKFAQSPRTTPKRENGDAYTYNREEEDAEYANDNESSGYTSSGNESNGYASLNPHLDASDNVSTAPLKSVTSASTKTTSLLSNNPELHSNSASIETSIPSGANGSTPQTSTVASPPCQQSINERDSDSVITLASSSRRGRRRSCETSSSTAAIPPSSIMERLAVHPNASASYANSVQNSFNERN